MILLNGETVVPTIFPDGTSQVWNLKTDFQADSFNVCWKFEEEKELVYLLSLLTLLEAEMPEGKRASLTIPYLPYGRQDKKIGNKECFNLSMLGKVLSSFRKISVLNTFDAHPAQLADYFTGRIPIVYSSPVNVEAIVNSTEGANLICFPDAGAAARYDQTFSSKIEFLASKGIHKNYLGFDKIRDVASGKITSHIPNKYTMNVLKLANSTPKYTPNIIVVDDICDGGGTFISLAKQVRELCPKAKLHLYVSHGLFSAGVNALSVFYDTIITTSSVESVRSHLISLPEKIKILE